MTHLKKLFIVFCLLASASFVEASGVISEQIYFLEEDGRHALIYTTSRSDYSRLYPSENARKKLRRHGAG
ncbi:MAG: hypothetical protein JRE47_11850 [Deltaproteobacteria bacterium]|nr:hypothetical protein [Deltaproteobacteria bacterium]